MFSPNPCISPPYALRSLVSPCYDSSPRVPKPPTSFHAFSPRTRSHHSTQSNALSIIDSPITDVRDSTGSDSPYQYPQTVEVKHSQSYDIEIERASIIPRASSEPTPTIISLVTTNDPQQSAVSMPEDAAPRMLSQFGQIPSAIIDVIVDSPVQVTVEGLGFEVPQTPTYQR